MSSKNAPIETYPLLGTLLRIPYQSMMAESVEPALETAGFGDVRSAHLPVFQALATHAGELRLTELARYAGITKQSMGYLVDYLEAGGYVVRKEDATDGRAKAISMTARAWEVSRTIRVAVRSVEEDWSRLIGAKRTEELRTILQELVAELEQRP